MKFFRNIQYAGLGILLFAFWLSVPQLMFAEGPAVAPEKRVSEDGRFIDHGDGTITDTQTGIMWMKEDSYQHTGNWLNWGEAHVYVENLNKERFANYIDWQMPTTKDLMTLYEPGKTNSAQLGREMKIHMDPIFTKEGSGASWAAEQNGNFNGFGIIFNTGKVFSAAKDSRYRKSVRAMRIVRP